MYVCMHAFMYVCRDYGLVLAPAAGSAAAAVDAAAAAAAAGAAGAAGAAEQVLLVWWCGCCWCGWCGCAGADGAAGAAGVAGAAGAAVAVVRHCLGVGNGCDSQRHDDFRAAAAHYSKVVIMSRGVLENDYDNRNNDNI